jgi:hypothetical protein
VSKKPQTVKMEILIVWAFSCPTTAKNCGSVLVAAQKTLAPQAF